MQTNCLGFVFVAKLSRSLFQTVISIVHNLLSLLILLNHELDFIAIYLFFGQDKITHVHIKKSIISLFRLHFKMGNEKTPIDCS